MIRTSAGVLLVALSCVACTSSSSSSSSGPTGACNPYTANPLKGRNGAHCDSNGDCASPTCKCKDGTVSASQYLCFNGLCDGNTACTRFCSTHGGAGSCDAGTD